MHHWYSYEIDLWMRWPPRDEKMRPHSLYHTKHRRRTIFIGNFGANDFPKSTQNGLLGKILIFENGTREGWDMVITILSRSPVHYINSRKGTIFYPKLARASKVSLVESSSKMHIFQSRKISRGGKDIPCWVIDRLFTAAFSTFNNWN